MTGGGRARGRRNGELERRARNTDKETADNSMSN